jgi:hypothetical protein
MDGLPNNFLKPESASTTKGQDRLRYSLINSPVACEKYPEKVICYCGKTLHKHRATRLEAEIQKGWGMRNPPRYATVLGDNLFHKSYDTAVVIRSIRGWAMIPFVSVFPMVFFYRFEFRIEARLEIHIHKISDQEASMVIIMRDVQ